MAASSRSPKKKNDKKSPAKAAATKKKTKAKSNNNPLNILAAVAKLSALYKEDPSREKVAVCAGYPDSKSGGFPMALSRLKSKGYVEVYDGKLLRLTELGAQNAGDAALDGLATSNADQHEKIKKELTAKMQLVFDLLANGRPMSRPDIAAALGYKSEKGDGFPMLLSRIKKKGFLEHVDSGMVQLTKVAFPFGRP